MKKEIPPWAFVVVLALVIAVIGWFYSRSNVFSSEAPIEKGFDNSPKARAKLLQQGGAPAAPPVQQGR
jgi:hypothetical protein